MRHKIVCLLLFLFVITGFCDTINVDCNYRAHKTWKAVFCELECYVKNDLNITSKESRVINSKTGTYVDGKTEKDEIYFYAHQKTINYFPFGLEKLFTNLIGISIQSCHLKEINQLDLKPHTNLTLLYLHENDIEVLENNLFEFNSKLKHVSFGTNKFIHIHPKVFDNLPNLISLYMDGIKCVNRYTTNDTLAVKEIIKDVKTKCPNPDYLKLDNELMKLEEVSRNVNQEAVMDFIIDITSLQNEMNDTKFSFSITDLEQRLQIQVQKANLFAVDIKKKISSLEEKSTKCEGTKAELLSKCEQEKQAIESICISNNSTEHKSNELKLMECTNEKKEVIEICEIEKEGIKAEFLSECQVEKAKNQIELTYLKNHIKLIEYNNLWKLIMIGAAGLIQVLILFVIYKRFFF